MADLCIHNSEVFLAVFHNKKDFLGMKKVGSLAYELLEMVEETLEPGITTMDINNLVHEKTLKAGAKSAPLGYKGFPASCCTSLNQVVCHGIPSANDVLKTGDIINVDVTPILNGYYGDTSRTFMVGGPNAVSTTARKIVQCAKEALDDGIEVVKKRPCFVHDIAWAITEKAKEYGFSVVYDFVGHGIGKVFHENPNIQHCYSMARRQPAIAIKRGMTFTIEPMINQGNHQTQLLDDGWTAETTDGGLSAQFEHTIGILPDGSVDVFTLP